MHRTVIIRCIAVVFLYCGLVYAQEAPKNTTSSPEKQPQQQDFKQMQEKYQQEMKRTQEEMRKREAQELEQLKQSNPQLYQERKSAMERQAKIQAVLSDFQQGRLTPEQAESQLFPLMKAEMRTEIESLTERISRLKKQLAFLEKAGQDPNLLIRRRVAVMLGKQQSSPEESIGFGY